MKKPEEGTRQGECDRKIPMYSAVHEHFSAAVDAVSRRLRLSGHAAGRWAKWCAQAAPVGVLLVAGCASTGEPAGGDAAPAKPVSEGSSPAASERIAVSPQALELFAHATATMAAGNFPRAEVLFQEFLRQYPQYPGAHVNLAIIYSNSGNEAKTRAAIEAALEVDPDFAPALNQLGMLLRKNGSFREAEAAYLKAVTVSPDYALAHYNLGVLNELYLRRLDAALEHFEHYQSLVGGGDEQVEKWITDLTRRVAASQRTANVAD